MRERGKRKIKVSVRESQETKASLIDLRTETTTTTDRGTRMVGPKVGPALNMLNHGLQVKNILVLQVGLVQR
jgi:hypothetical protein